MAIADCSRVAFAAVQSTARSRGPSARRTTGRGAGAQPPRRRLFGAPKIYVARGVATIFDLGVHRWEAERVRSRALLLAVS